MKPNVEPEQDEPLKKLLERWTVTTPLPPRFQEKVWQRIEAAQTHEQPSFTNWLMGWLESVMPRAQVAYSYVTLLLVLGVLAGFWAAQSKTKEVETALGARYVQSVDPYRK